MYFFHMNLTFGKQSDVRRQAGTNNVIFPNHVLGLYYDSLKKLVPAYEIKFLLTHQSTFNMVG